MTRTAMKLGLCQMLVLGLVLTGLVLRRDEAASTVDGVTVRSNVGVAETGATILRLSSSANRSVIERRVRDSGGRILFWLDPLSLAVVSGVDEAESQRWPGVASAVADVALSLPRLQRSQELETQVADGTVGSPIAQQQWNMRQIRADVAHAEGYTGKDAIVAVIDTGIYADHPDLVGNVLPGRNTYAPYLTCAGTPLGEPPDDPSSSDCPIADTAANPLFAGDPDNTTDDNGHGTYMAGLIAAHGGERGTGIFGVAPDAKLLPVRVCSTEGVCPLGALAAGVAYAVERGATIANVALNANFDISTEEGALYFEITDAMNTFAYEQGLTIIGPAGNESLDLDQPTSIRPLIGWHDNVVTATGVGPNGRLSSNQDPAGNLTFQPPLALPNTGRFVDIAGPGGDFVWTKPNDGVLSATSPIGALQPGLYFTGAGSSIGTAHVAGVAAQIIAVFGPQKPKTLMKHLYEATIDLGARGRDPETGFGLIDLPRAVGLNR